MANTVERLEENFPIFEADYSDSLTDGPKHVRSSQGTLFIRLANGAAFRWINLRIISSSVPLRLKYKCLYKSTDTEADIVAEVSEGLQCPQGDATYIKKIAFESKIYYRCWLARDQFPHEFERDPVGPFWYPSGQFCGTDEDNRWITALEIKMPPLIDGWRSR